MSIDVRAEAVHIAEYAPPEIRAHIRDAIVRLVRQVQAERVPRRQPCVCGHGMGEHLDGTGRCLSRCNCAGFR